MKALLQMSWIKLGDFKEGKGPRPKGDQSCLSHMSGNK